MRTLTVILVSLLPALATAAPVPPCGFVPPSQGSPVRPHYQRPELDAFVDSDVYPIRVHHYFGDEDLVPPLLEAAEASWEYQVLDWGWEPPAADQGLGGSDAVDFYLYDTEFGGYASIDEDGWFSTGTQVRCQGFLVINRLMDEYGVRITVPHEFNHLLQMWTDCMEDGQLFEASAVYAQDWLDPALDSAWAFGAAYQQGWYRALDFYDYAEPPQYGSFIFLQFLSERFGEGTGISTRELWDDATQGDWDNSNTWMMALERWLEDHWDDALPGPAGDESYTELAWQEFGEWRWFLGIHADDEHLQHGSPDAGYGLELPLIGTASLASLEQGPVELGLPQQMAELSAGVAEIRHPDEGWEVDVVLEPNDDGDRWALSLIQLDGDEAVLHRDRGAIALDGAEVGGVVGAGVETILVVVANVGDGDLDPREDDWDGIGGLLTISAGEPGGDDDASDDDASDDDAVEDDDGDDGGDGCACRAAPARGSAALVPGALALAWGLRRRR